MHAWFICRRISGPTHSLLLTPSTRITTASTHRRCDHGGRPPCACKLLFCWSLWLGANPLATPVNAAATRQTDNITPTYRSIDFNDGDWPVHWRIPKLKDGKEPTSHRLDFPQIAKGQTKWSPKHFQVKPCMVSSICSSRVKSWEAKASFFALVINLMLTF